jgi:tellurite resistance protein
MHPTPLSDEHGCIRRALVLVMMADGDLDPDELAAVERVYRKITGVSLTPEQIRLEASLAGRDGLVLGRAAGLGRGLDEAARLRVFQAAFSVAAADGFVLDEEDTVLCKLARDLELPEATWQLAVRTWLADSDRLP